MAVPAPAWRPRDTNPVPRMFPWQTVGVLVTTACLAMYLWLWIAARKPVAAGLLVIPLLLLMSAPVIRRAARREATFDLAGLLVTGLSLRFAYSYLRVSNASDAGVYFREGARLASSFRALHFDIDTGQKVPGTGALRYLAGLVDVVTFSNQMASFLVFTWLAFWGLYLMYRAFELAMPDGDRYRYARLVFLWPSLCFWPSSIGKESWLIFTIGAASLGAARVFTRRPGGYTLLVAALFAAGFVRPHVALLTLMAFVIALFVGTRHAPTSGARTPASIAKVAGLVVLVAVASLFASRTADFLGVNDLSSSSIDSALSKQTEQSTIGGSAFTPANASSPQGYAETFVTILIRPFPFESHNVDELLSAAEGIVLAGFAVTSWRRLASAPGRMRAQPYIGYALVFVFMFVYMFAAMANFGILARQRTQMLPFAFVLLCIPLATRARATGARRGAPAATA